MKRLLVCLLLVGLVGSGADAKQEEQPTAPAKKNQPTTLAKIDQPATPAETDTFREHTGPVASVSFRPDGKRIASGGGFGDRRIRLWDAATGEELHILTGHTKDVHSVNFSPDGKRIASGSYEKTIRLWEA